jgi:protein gp37
MGQVTGIEWCHHTYNPWMGCTKVSPACDHCYAEAQEDVRYGRVEWGGPCRRTTTVENMIEARRRIPILLLAPARAHWLSVAPLLEALDLWPWLGAVSIGSLSAARLVRRMPDTWSRTGGVICAISTETRVPRPFSSRCGSDKRSLLI